MVETREPAAISDIATFRDLLAGRWVGPALHAAATLNIPDALAGEPKPATAVADAVGADPIAVQRLLRALVTIGMVGQRDGEYELTPLGALLRADTPGRFRDQVLFTGGERALRSWARFHRLCPNREHRHEDPGRHRRSVRLACGPTGGTGQIRRRDGRTDQTGRRRRRTRL